MCVNWNRAQHAPSIRRILICDNYDRCVEPKKALEMRLRRTDRNFNGWSDANAHVCACVWVWVLHSRFSAASCRIYGRELIGLSVEKWKNRHDWVAAAAAEAAAAFHEHSIMQLTLTLICCPFAGFFGHAAYTSSGWRCQSILSEFRGGSSEHTFLARHRSWFPCRPSVE